VYGTGLDWWILLIWWFSPTIVATALPFGSISDRAGGAAQKAAASANTAASGIAVRVMLSNINRHFQIADSFARLERTIIFAEPCDNDLVDQSPGKRPCCGAMIARMVQSR
jgi:hypothetical protein